MFGPTTARFGSAKPPNPAKLLLSSNKRTKQQMPSNNIMGLDVGERRVGIALASTEARLPQASRTLLRGEQFFDELVQFAEQNHVTEVVVGMPRGLSGQVTDQTTRTNAFIEELHTHLSLPIHTQDEAVTSLKAKEELIARGKVYTKADVDALAAVYILSDYLER